MIALSIISPFYNSMAKSERLLDTLGLINDPQVEIILIDDGSSDNTLDFLKAFKERSMVSTTVISQHNKGPGGARNKGLSLAAGEYVWFVDSDDDINPEAIRELKSLLPNKYDFIDFNFISKGKVFNTIGLEEGEYHSSVLGKARLIERLGRMPAKIFKKNFLTDNSLKYPEYCIYEDNPYEFLYPFKINCFYKSFVVGYYHHEEFNSVTRGGYNVRFFDRMYTAVYGFSRVKGLACQRERRRLEEKFIRIYLFNTVGKHIRGPVAKWIVASRVMRQYRDVAKDQNIALKPLEVLSGNYKYKSLFIFLWFFSFLLPSQERYFHRVRLQAWGRPFMDALH